MAIDLQNPQNIETGWRGPTQFQAPSGIGEILKNRIYQQQLQQEQIASAIKQYQSQRSDAAYIQAAQNAGVLPQGDYSGMSAAQASDLAQRIQDQTQTSQEKYYDALTKILNDTGRRPPTGPLPSGGRPMTQGQQFNALKTQAGIYGNQADELAQQQEDYGLPSDVGPATHGYVMRDGKLDYAKTPEEQANPALVSSGDALAPGSTVPTFTPQVYQQRQAQSAARQQILQEQKRVQQQMLNPQGVNQNDVNQANQAQPDPGVTPTPIPYSQTIPTGTPSPGTSTLAPGAGNALSPQDQQAYAWAKANPNDPRAAAILKSLGM